MAHAAGTAPGGATTPATEPTIVSIAALTDATFKLDGVRDCTDISSESMQRGQLEVRRTGTTAADLVVQYRAAGADGDHEALPGQVTIPAGAARAVIQVDQRLGDVASPRHEHRSSTLSVALLGGSGYAPGGSTSASIAIRFDVDVYGCGQRDAGPSATSS